MADAADLKSAGHYSPCGFESHQPQWGYDMLIENYTLPDPDVVAQAEYRALYELLEGFDGDTAVTTVEYAIDVLTEVKDWCDVLIEQLRLSQGAE